MPTTHSIPDETTPRNQPAADPDPLAGTRWADALIVPLLYAPGPWLTCRLCGVTSPLVTANRYHVGGHGDVDLAECWGRRCEEVA